jgi:hypothetical protein
MDVLAYILAETAVKVNHLCTLLLPAHPTLLQTQPIWAGPTVIDIN